MQPLNLPDLKNWQICGEYKLLLFILIYNNGKL